MSNKIQLIIEFDPETGNVQTNGPLDNRMLCYGMLEMAREILVKRAGDPKQRGGRILVPQRM